MVTPFDADGGVDFDAFQALARYLVENGSDGVVVAGTTGESPTLSDGERLDLIRAALEAVGDQAAVVAGTGTYSTSHSIHLTEAAHELGASAFLVVAPYYSKPPQRGIVAHFEAIAQASDRPIIVYNIPARVVVNIEPDTISRLAEIETVRAVKQANADLAQARHIVGTASTCMQATTTSCRHFSSSAASAGSASTRMSSGHRSQNRSEPCWTGMSTEGGDRRVPRTRLRPPRCGDEPDRHQGRAALLGHQVGGLRLPLVEATEDEVARVRGCLERLGLLVSV